MAPITCKLTNDDETRRFTEQTEQLTYSTMHQRAATLFALDTPFKLQYRDDEGDVITMSTDEEMLEAVSLAVAAKPPVLRVSVKIDAKKPTASPAPTQSPPPDLSSLLQNISEQLPNLFDPSGGADTPGLSALGKKVGESLPAFVDSLPECIKAQIGNAELDLSATAAANAAASLAAACGEGKSPNITFSVLPPAKGGYGDPGVHPGVTCDKSGMNPIVGPRFNLHGHNYDLCEAEFLKLSPEEQSKFVRIEPPSAFDPSKCPWRPKFWRGGGGMGGGGGGGHCHGGMGGGCPPFGKLSARFVSDVSIFDGTQMAPSTKFTKIWRIKNSGETPWPAGTKFVFVGGDQMAADMTVPLADSSKVILPGEEVDIAVDMVAPAQLGRYLGYWRLVGPLGRRRFGQRVWCHIQVVDPSGGEAPHDPSAVAAEIDQLKAKAQKEALDHEEGDDAEPEASCASAASSSVSGMSSALASATSSEVASAPSSAVSSAVTSAASSAVSSVVSSAAAASAQKKKAWGEPKAEQYPNAFANVTPGTIVDVDAGTIVDLRKPTLSTNYSPASSAAHARAVKAEAKALPKAADEKVDIATELLKMGFESKVVQLVLEKHRSTPAHELLESCTRDLVQLSDWDSMLSDLEEMGFSDRELNTQLMVKNNGSVKRTVKDLVADN